MKDWNEIEAWRREQRKQLIDLRLALPLSQRRESSAKIEALIEHAFPFLQDMTIAFCWPYKAEVDVRFAIHRFRDRGATAALPEVTGKNRPLQSRKWWPGVSMRSGPLGIPTPQDTDVVIPQAAIVPLNGFDLQGYRLGYGGGYFDRTLAALERKPLTLGVGFEIGRLSTIYPQAHDIPMDFIVTEAGIHAVEDGKMEHVDTGSAKEQAHRLLVSRQLVRPKQGTGTEEDNRRGNASPTSRK
jgi:5-formyltetrahydrofolate cyclo-ligase